MSGKHADYLQMSEDIRRQMRASGLKKKKTRKKSSKRTTRKTQAEIRRLINEDFPRAKAAKKSVRFASTTSEIGIDQSKAADARKGFVSVRDSRTKAKGPQSATVDSLGFAQPDLDPHIAALDGRTTVTERIQVATTLSDFKRFALVDAELDCHVLLVNQDDLETQLELMASGEEPDDPQVETAILDSVKFKVDTSYSQASKSRGHRIKSNLKRKINTLLTNLRVAADTIARALPKLDKLCQLHASAKRNLKLAKSNLKAFEKLAKQCKHQRLVDKLETQVAQARETRFDFDMQVDVIGFDAEENNVTDIAKRVNELKQLKQQLANEMELLKQMKQKVKNQKSKQARPRRASSASSTGSNDSLKKTHHKKKQKTDAQKAQSRGRGRGQDPDLIKI